MSKVTHKDVIEAIELAPRLAKLKDIYKHLYSYARQLDREGRYELADAYRWAAEQVEQKYWDKKEGRVLCKDREAL